MTQSPDEHGSDPGVGDTMPPLGPTLSLGRAATYSAGSIGAGAFFAFNNFVLHNC